MLDRFMSNSCVAVNTKCVVCVTEIEDSILSILMYVTHLMVHILFHCILLFMFFVTVSSEDGLNTMPHLVKAVRAVLFVNAIEDLFYSVHKQSYYHSPHKITSWIAVGPSSEVTVRREGA